MQQIAGNVAEQRFRSRGDFGHEILPAAPDTIPRATLPESYTLPTLAKQKSALRVLHNPLAHRQTTSFPMIGKNVSNGWKIPPVFPTIGKIFRQFSNDWKNFSGAVSSIKH
jgi:hypothetical protein